MKRARSCWRVSAQPLTLRQGCPAAPRSRSVSWGSSAARAETGLAPGGEGQGLVLGGMGGHDVQTEASPHPHVDRMLKRGDATGAPQSPPVPSSYLAELLGLSVKEKKEGL